MALPSIKGDKDSAKDVIFKTAIILNSVEVASYILSGQYNLKFLFAETSEEKFNSQYVLQLLVFVVYSIYELSNIGLCY